MAPSSQTLPTINGLSLQAKQSFRAFNTDVSITLADWRDSGLLAGVEAFLHDFESRFSRFIPDSELSRFNGRQQPVAGVSPEMLALLKECVRLHRRSDGIFNPLIIEALEAAGYTTSFDQLHQRDSWHRPAPGKPPSLDCLRLDLARSQAELPLGLRLDFGGIGKGYAVDAAASLLDAAQGFLVDAGGDMYASGFGPDGAPWRIDVSDPYDSESAIDAVCISNRAIATSWTTRRRWQVTGGWAHHLIDPRSGRPAESGVIGSTVIAHLAVEADVYAKCALILGPEAGLTFLQERACEGLLVLQDRSQKHTPGWPSA